MPDKKPTPQSPPETTKSVLPGLNLPVPVGPVVIQAWMEIGTEAVRFVWDRLQQDIKTQQAMMTCTSLDQMQKVQADFFTAAQEQYTAEAAKMLDLMSKAQAAGLTPTPTARRYDDVPL